MKVILLVVVVGVVCIVLFAAGVFSPGKSRRMQSKAGRATAKGENKGERKAGKLGDLASTALNKSRHAMDRSAEKGREVHERAFDKFDKDDRSR